MGVSRGWTKTQDSSINCNGPELKNDGKDLPGTLHLVVGSSCFYIRFWWEALPWVSAVVPMRSSYRKELEKVKDNVEAVSHAERSVGSLCMLAGMVWSVKIEKKRTDRKLRSLGESFKKARAFGRILTFGDWGAEVEL